MRSSFKAAVGAGVLGIVLFSTGTAQAESVQNDGHDALVIQDTA